MAIPRFTAQMQQVQVPSMKNYQEEQNASIAKSLADFGSKIMGVSVKIGALEYFKKPSNTAYWERYKQATGISSNNSKVSSSDNVIT